MDIGLIILIILILLLIGAFPIWPHSRKWGYNPVGIIAILLIILIVLALTGQVALYHQPTPLP